MSPRLIVCIVPHGKGDRLASAANAAGAAGGTLLSAQGSAPNAVLQLLGIGVTSRELALFVVDEAIEERVRAVLRGAAAGERRHFGVLFSTDVAHFVRFGLPAPDPEPKETPVEHVTELISAIVNKGYAEDAMAAARKAGAGGGTVLRAHGTAKPDDESFFGVKLVPEKELLLILVPSENSDAVLEAIRSLPCLQEKGSGVAWRIPVRDFAPLGGE